MDEASRSVRASASRIQTVLRWLYHGQPENIEGTQTHTHAHSRLLSSHEKRSEIIKKKKGGGGSSNYFMARLSGVRRWWGVGSVRKKGRGKFQVEQHINPRFPRFPSSQRRDRSGERRKRRGGGGGGGG